MIFHSVFVFLLLAMLQMPAVVSAMDCTGCHAKTGSGDIRPLDSAYRNITSGGFQGSHQTHMSATATPDTCSRCHNNSAYLNNHRDGKIQISTGIGYNTVRSTTTIGEAVFFNQTTVPVLATCNSANCHFESISPVWGTDKATANLNCSSCHGNPPGGTSPSYAGGAAGSHAAHKFTCNKCHPDHTTESKPFAHATSVGGRDLAVSPKNFDGTSQVYVSADRKYLPSQASAHTFGTCSNLYCHSSVQADGGIGAPTYGTNRWGAAGVSGCGELTGCHALLPGSNHSNPAATKTIATGSHSKHILSASAFIGESIPANMLWQVCFMCHNQSYPLSLPTKNNSGCNFCHFAGSKINLPHVNGTTLIAFDGTFTTGTYDGLALNNKTPQTGYRACENTYCHSNGTRTSPPYVSNSAPPTWGSPGTVICGSCHKATSGTGFAVISTAGHSAHFTWSAGPNLGTTLSACQTCHIYSTIKHVNKVVDKYPCAPCHPGTEPGWTSKALACEECHGKNATVSVINSISAPDKWLYGSLPLFGKNGGGGHSGMGWACQTCHESHRSEYPEIIVPHISGVKGDYQGLNRPGAMNPTTWINTVNSNIICVYCHNENQYGDMKTHVRSKGEGTNASMTCVACHDVHGSGNLEMIRSQIWYDPAQPPVNVVFSNLSTFVQYDAPYQGLCQVCHTLTGHFKRGVFEPNGAGQHGSLAYRKCTSCHDHGKKTYAGPSKVLYAFQPIGCDGCHGYPPVNNMALYGRHNMYSTARLQNYSGGGGAHTTGGHLSASVKATDSNPWQACQKCHSGGDAAHTKNTAVFDSGNSTLLRKANTSVAVDANFKFNQTRPLDSSMYRVKTGDSAANSATCWNVSCHFQPTGRWAQDK